MMNEIQILNQIPKAFQNLKNPPQRLFYKGNITLLEKNKIALIGSRKMSIYTKNLVFELAHKLSQANVCVVSGGALGVDICAHQAAMPNTIAVFANSLDYIYPKSNEKIIKELYQKALALSEKQSSYLPKPYDFLHRNRLIIALCDKIIIAQASLQSGSFASGNLALKLGKELFVLAQRKNESEGTNLFLEQGKAKLINDFDFFIAKHFNAKNLKQEQICDDEILEFCKKGVSLNEALKHFGAKIYEYELEGKIKIDGVFIKVLV